MSDPTMPKPGDMSIDATNVTPIDLTAKQIQALLKLRAGYAAAVSNLASQPAAMLARAGIDSNEVTGIVASIAVIDRVAQLLPAAEKLAELLSDTNLAHAGKVAAGLVDAASQAKRRAKRDPKGEEILAALEPLLTYAAEPAKKAVATKAKKSNGDAKAPPPDA